MDHFRHPEHFTCQHCCQELGTRNFFERDGHPYCETDYHNLFSPRCAYCNGAILDVCFPSIIIPTAMDLISIFFFFHFSPRNALPLWTKHGTQSISSAANVVNSSAKKVSMNVTERLIAVTITSICSHQNVLAAIVLSWKITSQHWMLNGMPNASSVA